MATVLFLTLMRLYFMGDLMDQHSIEYDSIRSLSVVFSLALIPPFILLFFIIIVKKIFFSKLTFFTNRIWRKSGYVLLGGVLFCWGFFSLQPEMNYLINLIQGVACLVIFSLTYYALNTFLKKREKKLFLRWLSILLLSAWGLFTVYLMFNSRDYLKSKISPDFLVDKQKPYNFVMLGIDGMEWHVVNKLMDMGELPNLSQFKHNSIYAPLRTFKPTTSPYIWNTICTGYNPELHQLRPSVIALPFNTIIKRNHAMPPDPFQMGMELFLPHTHSISHYPLSYWEILMRFRYSAAVIGTWELSPLNHHGLVNLGVNRYDTYNLDIMNLSGAYFCPELQDYVVSINVRQDQIPLEEWAYFTVSGEIPQGLFSKVVDYYKKEDSDIIRLSQFRIAYTTDRFRFALAKRTLPMLQPPFTMMLYLQGIDTICHFYMHLYRGETDDFEEEDLREIVQRYYCKVDEWIGEIMSIIPENTYVMIISDHGFDKDYNPYGIMTASHIFAPDGVFMMTGPGLEPGVLEKVHVLDITPTILDILGVPELITMQGRSAVLDSVYNLTLKDWESMQVKAVQSTDSRIQNREINKKLRQLGYIK